MTSAPVSQNNFSSSTQVQCHEMRWPHMAWCGRSGTRILLYDWRNL